MSAGELVEFGLGRTLTKRLGFPIRDGISGGRANVECVEPTRRWNQASVKSLIGPEAILDRPDRDLGARCETELSEDVVDVGVHRSFGQHQLLSNSSVR